MRFYVGSVRGDGAKLVVDSLLKYVVIIITNIPDFGINILFYFRLMEN